MRFVPGDPLLILAYLDPGTGSLLLQVLLAGFLTGMFLFKSVLAAFRRSVNRVFKNQH